MDSFPDELLLEVFSWLEDGVTLLDGVSLVCKRWCALARDPQAWRSVRVEYEYHHWRWPAPQHANRALIEGAAMDNARVLLHAPAIRHLCWWWYFRSPHLNRPQAIALSAARRSRAAIREVFLSDVASMAEPAWAVLRGLLWRNREHITDLTTELPDQWEDSEEEEEEEDADIEESYDPSLEDDQSDVVAAWAEEDGYPASVLDVLVQMRRLERLVLSCYWVLPYASELQVEGELLPALRYLRLRDMCDHRVLLDLVRGTAARLHGLNMPDEYWLGSPNASKPDLPPAVVASLSRCVQLRSLAVNLMHVACVLSMPHLRRLELWLSSQEVRPQDVSERVRLLAQHSDCLAGLHHLSLNLTKTSRDPPMWENARASLVALLLAVASAARNVTEAEIYLGAGFEDLVPELLGCWLRLETVHISRLDHKDYVKALAALPNLRRVSGWSGSGDCPLSAAMLSDRLKAALPGVEVEIYC